MRRRSIVVCFVLLPLTWLAAADTAWVRHYEGPTRSQLNCAAQVAADRSGNIYVCGSGEFWTWPTNTDMLLVKYNPAGETLWARQYGGTGSSPDDMAHALVVDSANNVYMAGVTEIVGWRALDMSWHKYDSLGNVVPPWDSSKTFWPGDDAGYDIVLGRNNDVYICGARCPDSTGVSAFTVCRLDPDSGSIRWSRSYIRDSSAARRPRSDVHPSFFEDWYMWENCAVALDVTPDGSIVAAGFGTDDTNDIVMWIMEFDTAGNRLWEQSFDAELGPLEDAAFDVAVAPNGHVYAAGLAETVSGGHEFVVLWLDDTGAIMDWRLSGSTTQGDDFATRLVFDDCRPPNLYVTGTCEDNTGWYSVMTHKFSPTLDFLWGNQGAVRRGPGDCYGYGIDYDCGRVYVCGDLGGNIGVLCYSSRDTVGGELLWSRLFGSPDRLWSSGASVCAVDSDHIYVAGECAREGQPYEWYSMFVARFRTAVPGVADEPWGYDASRDMPHAVPNPCRGTTTLLLHSPPGTLGPSSLPVSICDVSGRVVQHSTVVNRHSSFPLDLRSLVPGVYLLRVEPVAGGPVRPIKIVVQ